MWKDVGYLIANTTQYDSFNKPYYAQAKRKVFCNDKGVKRSEFYQGSVAGFKPELCIELKSAEYSKETHFEFKNVTYRIIRTYPAKNECIELICTSAVNTNA